MNLTHNRKNTRSTVRRTLIFNFIHMREIIFYAAKMQFFDIVTIFFQHNVKDHN